MRIRDTLKLSFKALLLNKGRSVLTMLGIVIGISSVILMLSVGQAAQGYLLSQVSSFGSDLIYIANGPGDTSRGGPPSATVKQTLTVHDLERLKAQSWPKAIDATVEVNDLVTYNGQSRNALLDGVSPDDTVVFNSSVSKGRFISDDDVSAHSSVVVIGTNVAQQLFGEDDPINKSIKIGARDYHVIGVLAPAGTRFFSNVDDQVFAPYTTVMDAYNKRYLNFIAVKAGAVSPTQAQELIRVLLRDTHNINNPTEDLSKDDFKVATQADAAKNIATIGTILSILLGSIAGISLFVAGIGIMNIMYVTVTERTREIGLRKAIGATRGNILGQFLAEAVTLTVVAGAIGVMFGIAISWLVIQLLSHLQSGWSFVIPWGGIELSFGVSASIGIIFGYFPARKAAALSPIEALRYE